MRRPREGTQRNKAGQEKGRSQIKVAKRRDVVIQSSQEKGRTQIKEAKRRYIVK